MCIGNPTSPPCSYHQRGDLRWSRGHEFRPSHAKKREDLNGVLGLREDCASPPRHEFHPSHIKNKGRGTLHIRASTRNTPHKSLDNIFADSKSPLGGMSFTLLIARKGERIYEAPLNGDPRRVLAFIRTQVTVRIRGPITYIRFVIVI